VAGVKFLLSGLERSGKSQLVSQVKDAMVFNFDSKVYPFNVPHTNFNPTKFNLENMISIFFDKLKLYKKTYGKLPKVIIFDTITQLYTQLVQTSKDYSGFAKYNWLNETVLDINDFIDNSLLPNYDVIIVGHSIFDKDTGFYRIPAYGQFDKVGGWLSVVSDASYCVIRDNVFFIIHKNYNYPTRSTIVDIPEEQEIKDYNINTHLTVLRGITTSNKDKML
jgi:hypothetical protein